MVKKVSLCSIKVSLCSIKPISLLLCDLINESFIKGEFPDTLKFARVIPLHKGGSREDMSQYRPISILPLLSKILEKIVNKRLLGFLNKNDVISNSQFGYREKHSTSHAILSINEAHISQSHKVDAGPRLPMWHGIGPGAQKKIKKILAGQPGSGPRRPAAAQ